MATVKKEKGRELGAEKSEVLLFQVFGRVLTFQVGISKEFPVKDGDLILKTGGRLTNGFRFFKGVLNQVVFTNRFLEPSFGGIWGFTGKRSTKGLSNGFKFFQVSTRWALVAHFVRFWGVYWKTRLSCGTFGVENLLGGIRFRVKKLLEGNRGKGEMYFEKNCRLRKAQEYFALGG